MYPIFCLAALLIPADNRQNLTPKRCLIKTEGLKAVKIRKPYLPGNKTLGCVYRIHGHCREEKSNKWNENPIFARICVLA
jgi:hypothetical protein